MKLVFAGSLDEGMHSKFRMETIQRLGHTVIPFDFRDYQMNRYWYALAYRYGLGPVVQKLNKAFLKCITQEKPEVVWVEKGIFIQETTLRKIKRGLKTTLVHFNPDDPFGHYKYGWKTFIPAIPAYDIHFVPRPQNITEYQAVGAKKVFEYDRSYDARIHRPIVISTEEQHKYRVKVGFIGSYAPARADSIQFLKENGIDVAIYGNGWKESIHAEKFAGNIRSASVFGDEYAKVISGMDIALHFLRREHRDFQDSRTYELPACGTFMLAERSNKHEEVFEEDKEAVFFDTNEELLAKILYYLGHEEERKAIAAAGLSKCKLAGYDHESRLKSFLTTVKKNMHDAVLKENIQK